MPKTVAASAPVSGFTAPALFTPSVNRMMMRDLAGDFSRCETEVARAEPMAVPSSTCPIFTSCTRCPSHS